MRLLEALFKLQLPKVSHYKRDIKKCEKEILLVMDVRFISKKIISTKIVHRIGLHIVIKSRYCMVSLKNFSILKIDNFGIFSIYLSITKL